MNAFALRLLRILSAITGLAGLAGCTSVDIAALPVDQPLPEFPKDKLCRVQPEGVLKEGESCWFIVQPGVRYDQEGNGTGLLIKPNQHYEIVVPGAQYWYDLDRRVPAPDGDSGGEITKYFGFTKHRTEYKWFALLANVRRSADDPAEFDPCKTVPQPITQAQGMFWALTTGELYFYVNDAAWFYDNNSGRVLIEIRRWRDGMLPGVTPKPGNAACKPD